MPPPLRAALAGVMGALLALRKSKRVEPPSCLVCSITAEVFQDPVVVVSTGHTYERSAIEAWFASKSPATDPNTGCRCDTALVPNWALRDALNEWLAAQGRPALAAPAAPAPRPLLLRAKLGGEALEGPLGAMLALLVTLAASAGGGFVAGLFGTAPLASLVVVLLMLFFADADGAGAARTAAMRASLAQWRA